MLDEENLDDLKTLFTAGDSKAEDFETVWHWLTLAALILFIGDIALRKLFVLKSPDVIK